MYLDGDMELMPDWFDQAVPFLVEHLEFAGVAGYRHDITLQEGQIVDEQDYGRSPDVKTVEVKYFAGAALYRRSALEEVGGFNPYIISDEEPELCMRLRHAGYRLARLPILMCNNYTLPVKSWEYFIRRFRAGLWYDHGQVPRYHLKTGLFLMYLRERGTYVPYLFGILISTVSLLLTLVTGNIIFIGSWTLVVAMFLGVYWIKKRSLRKMWLSIAHQSFAAYGAVRGFLMAPRPPEAYPTDAEVVQAHYDRGSLLR